MKAAIPGAAALCFCAGAVKAESRLKLNEQGYLEAPGLNVTVFADIYPDGHQTGVTVIQHGERVAANGDLRLEPSPGQWSPMPAAVGKPVLDPVAGAVTQTLRYPDESKDRKGFNPIEYPDLHFTYHVRVAPLEGNAFQVVVDLDKPLPVEWEGKVGFNFELFPTDLFGKVAADGRCVGHLPAPGQRPGPQRPRPARRRTDGSRQDADRRPRKRPAAPADREPQRAPGTARWTRQFQQRLVHRARDDASWRHRQRGVQVITPNVDPGWRYAPVVQVSQVGYRPGKAKTVVIEQDKRDQRADPLVLYRMTEAGPREVERFTPRSWGQFLRYQYLTADLGKVTEPGMYELEYRGRRTHAFRIADDVYDRGVWQPTLEYFLPAQMCHMLVQENYRTAWHGLDHRDDARMVRPGVHFDGYDQGADRLTRYKPGERVPGLTSGGWHDAGDYDLRVESQMGTVWLLAKMVEEFGLDYDSTSIDKAKKQVQMLRPDGASDALQQVEHGLLSVLGGYRAMGRTYRGIIEPTLAQYTLLGDVTTQSDGLQYDPSLAWRAHRHDLVHRR